LVHPGTDLASTCFFDTAKLELLVGHRYRNREEAKSAIFE